MPLPKPVLRSSSLIQINTDSEITPRKILPTKIRPNVPMGKLKVTKPMMSTAQIVDAALESFFLAVNPTAYELDAKKARMLVTNGSYKCQERLHLASPEFWHKIVIVGGSKYYKDYVLKLIIAAAHPHDLIPVKYLKHENDTCFFLRECASAIDKLCRADLQIENPHGDSIKLRVILCAKSLGDIPVNTQVIISKTILKRYNYDTKTLNLSDFHNDPDFKDTIFCPLSQPKILFYTLNQVNSRAIPFEHLSLANNELVTLKPIEGVTCFKHVITIDLSRNKIASVEELSILNTTSMRDLILDNNPLCQNFEEEILYIKKIREVLPNISVLDGVKLRVEGIPRARRNFLICPQSGPLADQFIEHYFQLFDGPSRKKLYGMYHVDSSFTMTCTYIPGQSTSSTANLQPYMGASRNLLKLSDYSKTHHLLHSGQDAILKMLCKMPKTEHDFYTFSVDVPFYDGQCAVIHVNGVFREDTKLVRSFSRVFHLVCIPPDEWQISNDLLHISNGRTEDEARAFKIKRPPRPPRRSNITESDRLEITKLLSHVTDLKMEWARKCLNDMNWEFKDAITAFAEMYKFGKIPRHAFIRAT